MRPKLTAPITPRIRAADLAWQAARKCSHGDRPDATAPVTTAAASPRDHPRRRQPCRCPGACELELLATYSSEKSSCRKARRADKGTGNKDKLTGGSAAYRRPSALLLPVWAPTSVKTAWHAGQAQGQHQADLTNLRNHADSSVVSQRLLSLARVGGTGSAGCPSVTMRRRNFRWHVVFIVLGKHLVGAKYTVRHPNGPWR